MLFQKHMKSEQPVTNKMRTMPHDKAHIANKELNNLI
jgi:hypothetical protein